MYINMSVASPNGFFGMNVSGKQNPMFGRNHTTKTKENQSICKKGKKRSEESKQKQSVTKCKYTYTVFPPSGKSFLITNLKQFARDNNLNTGNAFRVISGHLNHVKGYRIIRN